MLKEETKMVYEYESDYEDDADFAYRNGEYNSEVDEYGN